MRAASWDVSCRRRFGTTITQPCLELREVRERARLDSGRGLLVLLSFYQHHIRVHEPRVAIAVVL